MATKSLHKLYTGVTSIKLYVSLSFLKTTWKLWKLMPTKVDTWTEDAMRHVEDGYRGPWLNFNHLEWFNMQPSQSAVWLAVKENILACTGQQSGKCMCQRQYTERNRFNQQVVYRESAARTFSTRKKLPPLYISVPFNSEQHCTWELLPPTFTWTLLTWLVNKHATLACLEKECFRKKHWGSQEKPYRWSFSFKPVLLNCTSEENYEISKFCENDS